MSDVLINSISTLAAAFIGALAAFGLQNQKAKRQEFNRRRIAVNRAIFELLQLWNIQRQYFKEAILPEKDSQAPWLHIQANVNAQFHDTAFDVDELFFLSDTEHAQFLLRLKIEELRYRVLKSLIEERSNLVLNRLQPKMESLGIKEGTQFKISDLEDALGPDLTNKLKSLTNAIIKHTEENIKSTRELGDEFNLAMKETFQKKRLFGLLSNKKHKILEVKYEE